MQRGIDSFFKKVEKKKDVEKEEPDSPIAVRKRKVIISSDEEDEQPKPAPKSSKKSRIDDAKSPKNAPRKRIREDENDARKKPALSKLKPIDPAEIFGDEPALHTAKSPAKEKTKTMRDLDILKLNVTQLETDEPAKKVEMAQKTPEKEKKTQDKQKKATEPSKKKQIKQEINADIDTADNETHNVKKEKPKKQKSHEDNENGDFDEHDLNRSEILSDEDRQARKRQAAILYQKYKNRTSCINPGSKEVPKGKPNCLEGLSFLVTGILESIERDEANSIIKSFGGKVMTTVGKRLNYLVAGEESGPKKMAQAEEFGVKIINEDGLFDLIRKRSGETGNTNGTSTSAKSPKIKEEKKQEIKKEKNKSFVEEPTKSKESKAPIEKEVRIKIEEEPSKSIEHADETLTWVEKYKPNSVKDIVGQQGPANNVAKLTNWLSKWFVNANSKTKVKPNPWAKNDDGSAYKAALLSGPPGIGKTTTAILVCKELGFDVTEFNASDTRSKRLLREEVSELLTNKSLHGYFRGNMQHVSKKHVLIMDEVDGMAGNEDRGGVQELIGLIKESSVPIICMCNDRNHQKMRSLVNYCYDLRFNRPRLEQIKARILSICFKEKIKVDAKKVDEIITATNNDIRQSINFIYMLSVGKEFKITPTVAGAAVEEKKDSEKTAHKDLKLGPWEVIRKVFSAEDHKKMSLYDKCDLFFYDYSLGPLFVQQNYLQVAPKGPKSEVLSKVAATADALSLGDLVDKRIRSNNAWSLLPTQAIFSSVLPGEYMSGIFTGQINFPGWLGKNSRANKRNRLAQEIHDHTRLRTSGSRTSIRLDYAPFLLSTITRPLVEHGNDGVPAALSALKEYNLLKEDIESLVELSSWPGKKNIMTTIDGRVKASLTRAFNKEVLAYSYSATAGVKKKAAAAADDDELLETVEEGGTQAIGEASDEEDNDKLENDALIKVKKTSAAASKATKESKPAKEPKTPKSSTSKKKATKK